MSGPIPTPSGLDIYHAVGAIERKLMELAGLSYTMHQVCEAISAKASVDDPDCKAGSIITGLDFLDESLARITNELDGMAEEASSLVSRVHRGELANAFIASSPNREASS